MKNKTVYAAKLATYKLQMWLRRHGPAISLNRFYIAAALHCRFQDTPLENIAQKLVRLLVRDNEWETETLGKVIREWRIAHGRMPWQRRVR